MDLTWINPFKHVLYMENDGGLKPELIVNYRIQEAQSVSMDYTLSMVNWY